MNELTEKGAAAMSREQALRTMATAAGVPEGDRRMAQIMLAGPEIGSADQALLAKRHRMLPMRASVIVAMDQIEADNRKARNDAQAEMAELAGFSRGG